MVTPIWLHATGRNDCAGREHLPQRADVLPAGGKQRRITIARRCLLLAWTITLLLNCNFECHAQSRDTELWTSFGTKISLWKKTELSLEQDVRFNDNISQLKVAHSDVGFRREFFSFLRTTAYYRLSLETDEKPLHTAFIDFTLRLSKKPIRVSYRLRLRNKFRPDRDDVRHLRQRVTLKFGGKADLKPYLAGELYYRFHYDKGDRFDKARFYMGLEWEAAKKQEFKLYFLYQKELNTPDPLLSTVFGLAYEYDW